MRPFNIHRHNRLLFGLLKLTIASILIWILAQQRVIDLSLIRRIFRDPATVVVVALLLWFAYSLSAWRWMMLLSLQGVSHTWREVLRVVFAALFLNNVLPAGGDTYRIAFVLNADTGHKASAVLSIIVDRVMGLYALMVIASALILMEWQVVFAHPPLLVFSVIVFTSTVALPIFFYFLDRALKSKLLHVIFRKISMTRPLHKLLLLLGNSMTHYRKASRTITLAMIISILIHLVLLLSFILLANAMNLAEPSIQLKAAGATLGWLSNLIPVTPGGIGVGEAVFDQICRWGSANASAGYGSAFLAHRSLAIAATLPGLLLLFVGSLKHSDRPPGKLGSLP